MADEQPGAAEDALHLQLEQVGIGIDAPVHAAGLDQLGDLVGVSVAHGSISVVMRPRRRGIRNRGCAIVRRADRSGRDYSMSAFAD